MITWPEADPREKLVATFDFSDEINPGESIASAIVGCYAPWGGDSDPAAILSGSPSIDGSEVLQGFHGGRSGTDYLMDCTATLTPTDRVLVRAAILPIRRYYTA